MIVKLHHSHITIPSDAEVAARKFYCDLLGLTEVQKPETLKNNGGFWLQLSNIQVHVGIEDGTDRTKTKAHVAYEVDDLETIRAKLVAFGLNPKAGSPIPGYERFECRDPFGNRMEFIQRTLSAD